VTGEQRGPVAAAGADPGAFVGRTGPRVVARHPVNEPMIAHFCDAIGDSNPSYSDADFAAASVHGGIVAPPAMLDVWDRGGLRTSRDPRSPRAEVLEGLFAAGFDSIVAVNTELEIARYLRPGELLSNVEVLEDVSAEKLTARGPGRFVTTRHRYTNEQGEHVGELKFRILVFRPEAPEPRPAPAGPSSDPGLRPPPAVNADNHFFWEGVRRHELRIQRCANCGVLLMPPGPRCPSCGSFDLDWTGATGRGRLYSFAVVHHPKVEGFSYPLGVALVELEEGTRVVTNLAGIDRDRMTIGMPLELCWLEGAAGGLALPQFRAPAPVRRPDTLSLSDLNLGERFPLCSLPVTTTLVVAGAISTRDYTAVHHDRTAAEREGSTDVFLNINTSVGLLQRVVSDWTGPEALFRSIRVRLGAPAYPGDLLTFSGEVSSIDAAGAVATIAVKASDSLGDHLVAAVELSLPAGRAS
jgi:uncharacterized OB-fold protein/acyl dehydratase